MKDRIESVADLLMGAAYADNNLEGAEKRTIKDLLCDLLGEDELPMAVGFRLDGFAPKAFDVKKTASVFAKDSADSKRKLLQLVAAVHDADDEYDLAEDEYLVALAKALGVPDKDYRDLALEIVEETDLGEAFEEVRFADE